mmetsp:Transcript_20614/g.52298  ORF Transcript_20614/g.52298 Transcript_20614/m.52298 type:complete len:239 (+) Transcript_20614:1244-1960(+)
MRPWLQLRLTHRVSHPSQSPGPHQPPPPTPCSHPQPAAPRRRCLLLRQAWHQAQHSARLCASSPEHLAYLPRPLLLRRKLGWRLMGPHPTTLLRCPVMPPPPSCPPPRCRRAAHPWRTCSSSSRSSQVRAARSPGRHPTCRQQGKLRRQGRRRQAAATRSARNTPAYAPTCWWVRCSTTWTRTSASCTSRCTARRGARGGWWCSGTASSRPWWSQGRRRMRWCGRWAATLRPATTCRP